MRPVRRILSIIIVTQALWACVSHPNAYKERDEDYGYTGYFLENVSIGNMGGVTFTGDEAISRQQLRRHCWRRIAELCFEKGYDFFDIITAKSFNGTTQEEVTTWWGTVTDGSGNKYNRYKTHYETVPTSGMAMLFEAFRGPMPVSVGRVQYQSAREILREYHESRFAGRSLEDPAAMTCASCRRPAEKLRIPEHCPGCGLNLFSTVLCPFCHETVDRGAEGIKTCPACSETFRVTCCPTCRARYALRDFSTFECSFCGNPSEPGILTGGEVFQCLHCNEEMAWPEELFGDYECPHCKEIFYVFQCSRCSTPHVLLFPLPFTCWGCGGWVDFGLGDNEVLPCPHCGMDRTWPNGESAVGLCFRTSKKTYLTHCRRCGLWLIEAEEGPFFCHLCGTWTSVFRCAKCKGLMRGHPFDPPKHCTSCMQEME